MTATSKSATAAPDRQEGSESDNGRTAATYLDFRQKPRNSEEICDGWRIPANGRLGGVKVDLFRNLFPRGVCRREDSSWKGGRNDGENRLDSALNGTWSTA